MIIWRTGWLSGTTRELVRVSAEVDAVYEIAAITDRVRSDQGSPAVLFDHVRGQTMPVVTNLLGSPRRLSAAFGVTSLDALSQRIDDWLSISLPRGKFDTWKLLPRLAELSQWPPTVVKSGLCQQVVKLGRDVNLADLPALTMWPGDAAPDNHLGAVAHKYSDWCRRNVRTTKRCRRCAAACLHGAAGSAWARRIADPRR